MKIEADSGYIDAGYVGRGFYVDTRTVVFSEATAEEIESFIAREKKSWYGQQFSARILGKTVHIRRSVDSGD